MIHVGEREPVVERDPVARIEVAVLAAVGEPVLAVVVPWCSWTNSTSWRRSWTTFCLVVVSAGWPLAPLSV